MADLARLSQLVIEAVSSGEPVCRNSQTVIEIIYKDTVTLAIDDIAQASTLSSCDVTRTYLLLIDNLVSVTTVTDELALLQKFLLSINNVVSLSSLDSCDVVRTYLLAIEDIVATSTLTDNLELLQKFLLVIQDIIQETNTDSLLLLTPNVIISVQANDNIFTCLVADTTFSMLCDSFTFAYDSDNNTFDVLSVDEDYHFNSATLNYYSEAQE